MLNPKLVSNFVDLGNEVHLRAMLTKFTKKIRSQENKSRGLFIHIYYIMVLKLNFKSKYCLRAWAPLRKKCLDESEIKN